MPPEVEWETLARSGRIIHAAKVLAAQTGMGMAAAYHVEEWYAKNCLPPDEGTNRLCSLAIRRQIAGLATEKAHITFTKGHRTPNEDNLDPNSGPDLSVWLNGETKRPPDLAVHIVYPSDGHSFVLGRVRRFFREGARMVWVATSETRIVHVFRPDLRASILDETQVISGEDVLPGFSCKVAELFS